LVLGLLVLKYGFQYFRMGDAAAVSGIDWLKAMVPIATRKREFDPVIDYLHEVIPGMRPVEQKYSISLINRITGRPTFIQEHVDDMINGVRMIFGKEDATISPSAQFAAGLAGLACVASDRGGNPEIIEHGRSGLLWPYGRVEVLRETLARLARDEDLRLTLARGAKARSAAFDFRETVARTIEQLGA
jgi:hypothetical protein